MLLPALSSGHKLGLALAVAGFAGFSLIVALLVPRWRPQFPGRGLWFFLVVIVLLFVGMMSAVVIFGRESTESEAATGGRTIDVTEIDYKIRVPQTSLPAGKYTFRVKNDGKVVHNLTITGPGGREATPDISPGNSASLEVALKPGNYDFFCSIPGHKQLGMNQAVEIT